MERVELSHRWDHWRNRSSLRRLPRWIDWRVTKKLAKWSRRPRPRETRLFWGQPMTIVYPEYVSAKIGRAGYFEVDLTSIFVDLLRPGMVVYDVGSHFGYFSLLASELVGKAGQVHAFEPTPRTYHVLAQNASRRENIACHNLAAYRETSEISFWDQGLNGSCVNFVVSDQQRVDPDHTRRGQLVRVPAVRLDDFVTRHTEPDFLKIDAEGAEGPILEGMSELIERSHPAISLEVGDSISQKTGNAPSRNNVQWLLDRGYEVYEYRSGEPQAHEPTADYTYANLLFRHPQWRFFQSASEVSEAA